MAAVTRWQMRLLHVLGTNGRLIVTRDPHALRAIDGEGKNWGWQFRPVTVNALINANLMELVRFQDTSHHQLGWFEAEYKINEAGLNALAVLCKHKPEVYQDRQTVEIVAGQLICTKCGRSVPCASRKKAAHPAHAWHWKYGPMCKWCWRQVFGGKPPKEILT